MNRKTTLVPNANTLSSIATMTNEQRGTDPESISNVFSSYFNSIYVPSSLGNLPVIPFSQHTSPSDCSFSVDDVEKRLAELKI